MQFEIHPGKTAVVIASTETIDASGADTLRRNEIARRAALRAAAPVDDPLVADLAAAADQFIVKRAGNLHTVIAGYHWFTDWGRDTMIASPGLTLTTGRLRRSPRDILRAFAHARPRRAAAQPLPRYGESARTTTPPTPRSGSSTPSHATSSTPATERLRAQTCYRHHARALSTGICAARASASASTADGLLARGRARIPAHLDGRQGRRLGRHAARTASPSRSTRSGTTRCASSKSLASKFGDGEAGRLDRRHRAAERLDSVQRAVLERRGGLPLRRGRRRTATIPPAGPTRSCAISRLHHACRPIARAASCAVVERDLLTPVGLRSLAPADPDYKPHYDGDPLRARSPPTTRARSGPG